MCVLVYIVLCVFGKIYRICTCLQHLYFPEEGCGLQPKHVGAIKTSLQLVGDKLMYVVNQSHYRPGVAQGVPGS